MFQLYLSKSLMLNTGQSAQILVATSVRATGSEMKRHHINSRLTPPPPSGLHQTLHHNDSVHHQPELESAMFSAEVDLVIPLTGDEGQPDSGSSPVLGTLAG